MITNIKKEMISVIVPIYNVEKYLKKCIESLLNQTYNNYEIILIDDGSTDNSSKICDMYSNNKKIRIIHKRNGGLSSARNYGINIARGKYISFVDSDDFVESDFLESLYYGLTNSGKSISACGVFRYYSKNIIKPYTIEKISLTINKEDAHKYAYIIGYYDVSMWNKLFDRKLFEDIRFPINRKSEDVFILYKLIEKSNGIYYNSNPKYYYRKRPNSISSSNEINYDIIDATNEARDYYIKNNYKEALLYSTRYLLFAYIGIYNIYLCKKKNCFNERENIRKKALYLKKMINYKYLRFQRRIQLFLFLKCKYIYNIIYKFYYKTQRKIRGERNEFF